jgi:hypothetical protein
MRFALAAVLLLGCSQHVYSPPTQAYSLGSVHPVAVGDRGLDLEASSHSAIFEPAYIASAGRFRYGIGNDAEISGEAAIGNVDDHGSSKADRNVYAGRFGFRINPAHGPFTASFGTGGGWAPAGGSFAALDGGLQVGADNCYVVPIAAVSAFASQPIASRPIDVGSDEYGTSYSTARRTAGGTVRGGLRFSLSPSACHAGKQAPWITAGFDITTIVDATDDLELFGLGLGLEVPL